MARKIARRDLFRKGVVVLITPGRPEPHIISTQEYLFGAITPASLFPADQIVSSGLEGATDERQPSTRSVAGGTGRYAGARGVVIQRGIGTNSTIIVPAGAIPAPNFRFEFRLQ